MFWHPLLGWRIIWCWAGIVSDNVILELLLCATDSLADDYCSVKWPFSQDVMSLGHALCCSSSVCAMIFKGREKTLMDHWLRLHVNPFLVLAATISPRCYFYIQLKSCGIFTLFLTFHIKINVHQEQLSSFCLVKQTIINYLSTTLTLIKSIKEEWSDKSLNYVRHIWSNEATNDRYYFQIKANLA